MVRFAEWSNIQTALRVRFCLVLACLPVVSLVTGCHSRPDPFAVVKDGADDEDDAPRPAAKTVVEAQAEQPLTPVGDGADSTGATDAAAAESDGAAPFDVAYLPTDSELLVYVEVLDILGSDFFQNQQEESLNETLPIFKDFGLHVSQVESITVGIRDLQHAPAPPLSLLTGGLDNLSLMALASHPDVQSTIVIRTNWSSDDGDLIKVGEQVKFNDSKYYRLPTTSFLAPCAFIAQRKNIVISDESTVQTLIQAGLSHPHPSGDFSFARSADIVIALRPQDPTWVRELLPSADTSKVPPANPSTSVEASAETAEVVAVTTISPTDSPQSDPAAAPVASVDQPVKETAASDPVEIARSHATGTAIMVNFTDGITLSSSLVCDEVPAAEVFDAAIQQRLTKLKSSPETTAPWPAVIKTLMASLRTQRMGSLTIVGGSIPPTGRREFAEIPGFLTGLAVGRGIVINEEMAAMPEAAAPAPDAELVWTPSDAAAGLPDGLEASVQARWDNPDAATREMFTAVPAAKKQVIFNVDDDDEPVRRTRTGRPGARSDQPLRLIVELTGPMLETSDSLGHAAVTSIESDFGTPLALEAIEFRQQDLTQGFLAIENLSATAETESPSVQVSFLFTPPLAPIESLTRFNGLLKMRIARNRQSTVITNLADRTQGRIATRELSQLRMALVAAVEEHQILVRVTEGNDEQISQLVPVDTFGDPISGVTTTIAEGTGTARGRLVHTLKFPAGVPPNVGLRVHANAGVTEIDVPFRFVDIPVPPPRIPGR